MALYRVTVLQMVKPILCQRRHLLARHKVDSMYQVMLEVTTAPLKCHTSTPTQTLPTLSLNHNRKWSQSAKSLPRQASLSLCHLSLSVCCVFLLTAITMSDGIILIAHATQCPPKAPNMIRNLTPTLPLTFLLTFNLCQVWCQTREAAQVCQSFHCIKVPAGCWLCYQTADHSRVQPEGDNNDASSQESSHSDKESTGSQSSPLSESDDEDLDHLVNSQPLADIFTKEVSLLSTYHLDQSYIGRCLNDGLNPRHHDGLTSRTKAITNNLTSSIKAGTQSCSSKAYNR